MDGGKSKDIALPAIKAKDKESNSKESNSKDTKTKAKAKKP